MNKCHNCGSLFDKDEALIVKEDPSPAGVGLPAGEYVYVYCPHCGDDDFEEDFNLLDAIDIEEGNDETSVVISYGGKQIELYLDEDGCLEGRHINSKGSAALIKRPDLAKREEVSA